MKPAILAVIAIFLYALQNIVISRKLSQYSALGNIFFVYLTLAAITLPLVLFHRQIHLDLILAPKATW